MFGDFRDLEATIFNGVDVTGGNDLITAAPDVAGSSASRLGHPSAMLIGDAVSVAGTEFTINGHLYEAAATLHGGNDTLLLTNQAGYDLVGDVYVVDYHRGADRRGRLHPIGRRPDPVRSHADTKFSSAMPGTTPATSWAAMI